MMLSTCIPVGILSIFPHQEPRFLIPILFPLAYLHSSTIFDETETALIKASKKSKRNLTMVGVQKSLNCSFKFWIILNTFCVIFYGFVHQAGVFPAVSYLSEELQRQPITTKFHVFTSHIYLMPESFLLQTDPNKLHITNKTKYNVNKRCFLHEEGSTDLDIVLRNIKVTLDVDKIEEETKKQANFKFYLVLPSSLEHYLMILLDDIRFLDISVVKVKSIYPHLSIESLPNISNHCLDLLPVFKCKQENTVPWHKYILNAASLCGLNVYEVSRK